jgi:hypothetical protein
VIVHLVLVPAGADAEHEAAARQLVEAGDRLGVATGSCCGPADAGADLQLLRRRGGESEADERIVGVGIALGQLAAAGEGRLAAGRDVGVLGHEQRIEATLLQRLASSAMLMP